MFTDKEEQLLVSSVLHSILAIESKFEKEGADSYYMESYVATYETYLSIYEKLTGGKFICKNKEASDAYIQYLQLNNHWCGGEIDVKTI